MRFMGDGQMVLHWTQINFIPRSPVQPYGALHFAVQGTIHLVHFHRFTI